MLVSFSNLLTAEILFDLHAQHFSNVKDGGEEFGRYNLPKVYVSTAARNHFGTYYRREFSVELKSPPASWSVTFDLRANIRDNPRTLSFVANTGKTISVTFREGKILFNGHSETENIYDLDFHASISGTLTKEGNQVVLRVNGFYKRMAMMSDFPKLKKVIIPTASNCVMTALTIGKIN